MALAERGEQDPGPHRRQRRDLLGQTSPDALHDRVDRLLGRGRDARELAFVLHDLKQRPFADDLFASAVRPDDLVGGLFDVRGEPVGPKVFGVTVGDGVDEPVAVDHVGADGLAVGTGETCRHEQPAGVGEVGEQSLVGLGGGDVGFVHNDEVDVVRAELGK